MTASMAARTAIVSFAFLLGSCDQAKAALRWAATVRAPR